MSLENDRKHVAALREADPNGLAWREVEFSRLGWHNPDHDFGVFRPTCYVRTVDDRSGGTFSGAASVPR